MVAFEQYMKEKTEFFHKHGEFRVHDKGMDKTDHYFKSYAFGDGALWCEVSGPVYEHVPVEVHGVRMTASVKLFRTEYWSSEAGSKFVYDKYL